MIRRPTTLFFALWHWRFALVWALVAIGRTALGQAPDPVDARRSLGAPAPLQFRRVFAPADRADDWPRNRAEKYLPMDSAEFERLLKILEGGDRAAELAAAHVSAAYYEARLNSDDSLSGRFRWEIERENNETSLLSLEPCSLALRGGVWAPNEQNLSSGVSAPAEALIGAGPEGRLGLIVDRRGSVEGEWSARGQRTAGGTISFPLDIPQATLLRITWDLPEKMTAEADHGLVREAPGGAPPGQRRWLLDLGGQTHVRIRALAEGAASERRRLTLLRETFAYQLTKRGLDLSAALRLDVHHESLSRL